MHDARTAQDLEWSRLLVHIATHCEGDSARARLLSREPKADALAAQECMRRTAESMAARGADEPPPCRAVPDVLPALQRLGKQATLSGTEFRDLSRVLALACDLDRWQSARAGRYPRLALVFAGDASLPRLQRAIDDAIDDDGSVADRASPELAAARRRAQDARSELKTRLAELVRRHASALSDQYWTERDGRYVLPVRADAHTRVSGIVLGSSASGATLFVEPREITPLGNRLSVALAEEEREAARVLARLSTAFFSCVGELTAAFEACLEVDVLAALVSWADATHSLALEPESEPLLSVRGARHPLLVAQGQTVVPSDLELSTRQALVVSGPNAGGKTVALKCAGLLAWCVRAGIPVPVLPGSRIGFFDPVLTDVGDEQSLERSLSTFSAHVERLSEILAATVPGALLLLDEVAAGTDPEEGAALATAVIEHAVERGAATFVTTHYERLKERALEDPRFVNASVGFDFERMEPTFRLSIGFPGASSALAVARRHGIPASVVERAEALLPEASQGREHVIQRLERERLRFEAARQEAERDLSLQKLRSAEREAELEREQERERARLARQASELSAEVRRARGALAAAQKRLAQGVDAAELRAVAAEVNEAARQVAIGSRLTTVTQATKRARTEPAPEQALTVGTRVFVVSLNAAAEVLAEPDRGRVRVAAGALKLTVPVADLRLANREERSPKKPVPRAPSTHHVDGYVPMRARDNTLDLRGQRVEEALDAVESFVDRLLRSGERAGFVLHGHGTGALKAAVREHLGSLGAVRRSEPAAAEDGGDAFTIFWLDG